ncbi:MAG: DUF494 family protein [Candidatus Krumholzibacteriia bacterium]
MVDRLMDLVVLVAEFSQHKGKSLKELDKELIHLGYSTEEIQEALSWITSLWRPIEHGGGTGGERPVFRILAPWEAMTLDSGAHGYLLRLQNLGLLDEVQFERIMKRMVPYAGERMHVSDVKALAGRVLFNVDAEDIEETLYQVLDDEMLVI